MFKNKRIVCIIPARLQASRFPRKVIADLHGKPLIQWVWEAATKTTIFDTVVSAVDAAETERVVKRFGGTAIMTSPDCQSGTDRLVEIMQSGKVEADIWVNWQGDEPFITQHMIEQLLQSCDTDAVDMWTLKKRITTPEQADSPHIAKVICDMDGCALYFSRSTIPHYRDTDVSFEHQKYYKHIGIYAYTTNGLRKIAQMGQSYQEDAEKLEQLRFLHHKLSIKVHETEHDVFGIDLPEHLEKAAARIKSGSF